MKLRKAVAILLSLFLMGQGIWFVTTHISSFYFARCIEMLEKLSGDLLLPGTTVLGEEGFEKTFTDWVLEATFTPWYYEEAYRCIGEQIKTQENEAYLECVIENDSTDYYQLMQQENENAEELQQGMVDIGDQQSGTKNGGELQQGTGEFDGQQSGKDNGSEQQQSTENSDKQQQDTGECDDPTKESEERNSTQKETENSDEQRNSEGENITISPRENPQYQYDSETLSDYDKLVKAFYIIDENTKAGSDILDAKKFEKMDFTVEKHTDEPVILVYHTHSLEDFCNSREGVTEDTVVGAGRRLTTLLEAYGYTVLHDETAFDLENRDYAYSNALPHIEKVLKEHPEIQVIIDLHRDEMPEETHLVSEIDGKRCARYMFFDGMSRLKGKGEIDYLENPYRDQNLGFSFQLQKNSNEYYPGLARRIYLKAYRYNLHLRPASVLVELGAQNNTVEEIFNSCEPLAQVLDLVLSGENKE